MFCRDFLGTLGNLRGKSFWKKPWRHDFGRRITQEKKRFVVKGDGDTSLYLQNRGFDPPLECEGGYKSLIFEETPLEKACLNLFETLPTNPPEMNDMVSSNQTFPSPSNSLMSDDFREAFLNFLPAPRATNSCNIKVGDWKIESTDGKHTLHYVLRLVRGPTVRRRKGMMK